MNVNLKDIINEIKTKTTTLPERFTTLSQMSNADWTSKDREYVINTLSQSLLNPDVLRILSTSKTSRPLLPELYSRLLSTTKLLSSAERVESVAAAIASGLPLLCPNLMAAPILDFFRRCCCTPFEWISSLTGESLSEAQIKRAERVLLTAETLFSSRVVGPQLLKMWGCAPIIGFLNRVEEMSAAASAQKQSEDEKVDCGNNDSQKVQKVSKIEGYKTLSGLALRVLAACWNVPVSKVVSAEARGALERLAINGEIGSAVNNATVFLNTNDGECEIENDEWTNAIFGMHTTPDIIEQDKEVIDLTSTPKTTITLSDTRSATPTAQMENGCITTYSDISERYVDVQGVLLPYHAPPTSGLKTSSQSQSFEGPSFVETATTARNLHGLALAVSQGSPVLLEGPTGSGKTALVEHIAALTGNSGNGRLVRVHLGDQTDAKTLLGSYVTTETPSEFRWQPGVLAQAVSRGLWILVEDIDIAPMDVLSVLIPLLETRRLFIPGRGEVIDAAAGFQLFATRTLVAGARSAASSQGGKLLDSLWSKVVVEPLSSRELERILAARFRQIEPVADKFVETFDAICDCFAHKTTALCHPPTGTSPAPAASPSLVRADDDGYIPPSALSRTPSARDVIKWAQRVATLCGDRPVVSTPGAPVPSEILDMLFVEAMDCFCAAISNRRARKRLADVIARVWNIVPEKVTCLLELRKPDISAEGPILTVGRVSLAKKKSAALHSENGAGFGNSSSAKTPFAHTGNTLRLLEQIALCVSRNEPVLLVGETGTGKTTVVQHLAAQLGRNLVVQNLSQQTDSADLIGGFKPVELRLLCAPIKERFEALFVKTFSRKSNAEFLTTVATAFAQQDWPRFVALIQRAFTLVDKRLAAETEQGASEGSKRKPMAPGLRAAWEKLRGVVNKFEAQQRDQKTRNSFAFSFVEGTLVKAVRNGDWVLLDEINLATTETLESLSGLLEGGSLTLNEIGDLEPVPRHRDFRIFACMNPPTDVGKKDLPPGLRNRFTELYVEEMDARADLELVVGEYLRGLIARPPTEAIVTFYLKAKELARTTLVDGARQKTHYSLRTLTRALQCTRVLSEQFGFVRGLYEGVCMSFLTQLNQESLRLVEGLIQAGIAPKGMKPAQLRREAPRPGPNYVLSEYFWVEQGSERPHAPGDFILTASTRRYLAGITRAIVSGRHPVLLQGPTSTGKTSMVSYLARCTGHKFVRINNHEHTDIQEYLGAYVGDEAGRLVFREGALVEAVRNGYWVLLDELNLAPSEVLEALNRLLDANRELFVPETQETIRAHPHFMLFATQNPPGLYGGRKALSRAFRNRFIEIHVEDYPDDELSYILERRCTLPPSRTKLLVEIMKDLQRNRAITQVFAGRNSFITLRDLFRWAERKPEDNAALAAEGYCLLVERLRRPEDKRLVQDVLERHLKVKIDPESMIYSAPALAPHMEAAAAASAQGVGKVVWTKSMRRLFALVQRCLEHREPVLLVGETGCGKTTVCQLWAQALGLRLRALNCHQHTETADFLGGLRPVRGKEHVAVELAAALRKYLEAVGVLNKDGESAESTNNESTTNEAINSQLKELIALYEKYTEENGEGANVEESVAELREKVDKGLREYHALFAWVDGPLIEAMRDGDMFLIDEISLAEDAVLERLNSVLEPTRTLFLAEKGGGGDSEVIVAHKDFRIVATMNPGGDFGKRELSPAMRNRFTEIWVPAFDPREDLAHIIDERLARPALAGFTEPLLEFVEFFATKHTGRSAVSVRDLLSWVQFMNECAAERHILAPWSAYVHGACMILLDGIGVGSGLPEALAASVRQELLDKIISQVPADAPERASILAEFAPGAPPPQVTFCADGGLTIGSFHVAAGPHERPDSVRYELRSPTTAINALRVLRAMEIPGRAVLLEGSPGVGKTSLIWALAAATGHRLTRINLSEQTDIGDLMGADLPIESSGDGNNNGSGENGDGKGENGGFSWRDGAFLAALKAGDWVLLDELNLASQSVLEGLNSVLDHRGEAFIPELGRSFKCPKEFRVFAAQNPTQQGGGRKGLPKSFLSRFSQVYVDKLKDDDLLMVATSLFPTVAPELLRQMIDFNAAVVDESVSPTSGFARKGSPWEFNLRDIFRWCELMTAPPKMCSLNDGNSDDSKVVPPPPPAADPSLFAELVYSHRLRTASDRTRLREIYNAKMSTPLPPAERPHFRISDEWVQVGYATVPRRSALPRSQAGGVELLQGLLSPLQDVLKCVEMGWLCIVVGPSAAGKTSLVRLAAELTGNVLHEFSMNSSVDTTELLGGFEQVDLARHTRKLAARFARLADTVCGALLLKCGGDYDADVQREAREALLAIQSAWGTFCTRSKLIEQEEADISSPDNKKGKGFDTIQTTALTTLLTKVESINTKLITYDDLPPNCVPESLRSALSELAQVESKSESGCFEWIDGLLIQAMEAGDWLLIDNVNFCNPTVLDRLNSVLEPGGVLAVNERGMEADGQIKSVRPHPNFRIFFTMDPHNGEISRAMRNRGIEICLLEHEVDSRDTVTLLNATGIPGGDVPRAMVAFHVAAQRALTGYNASRLSLRDVLQWARLAVDQAQRGVPALRALFFAMEQVYIRPCCTGGGGGNGNGPSSGRTETRALVEIFARIFAQWTRPASEFQPSFRELGMWPTRASGDLWRRNAAACALILDAAPAETCFEATAAGARDWPALADPLTFYNTIVHGAESLGAKGNAAVALVPMRGKGRHYRELSLRHLIETSTAEDAANRLAWLLSYSGADSTVDAAVYAMRALGESALLQQSSAVLVETCRALGVAGSVTGGSAGRRLPFALGSARCFRDLLVRLAGDRPDAVALVRRCDGLSRRVGLFVRLAMDDYAEARACDAAEQSLGTRAGAAALAPLQRSILFARNRIFRESIKNDWECHGWNFLTALTASLKEWLLTTNEPSAEDFRAIEGVVFTKEALVRALCRTEGHGALTLDDVVWNWDNLLKALHRAGPLLPSSERLAHTYGKLCASLAALCVAPSRLWRSVRPRPYRHASLWGVQRDVAELGGEMSLSSYASILPDFVARAAKPQLRKTLMEAAANFRWSMLLSKTATAQEGADEEDAKRAVGEALRLIREKMGDPPKKPENDNEDEDGDVLMSGEAAEMLVDDEGMPIVKSVFNSLWKVHNDQAGVSSLVDYSTVMREQEVLAHTLRGTLGLSAACDNVALTRDVFDAHQRLVKQGANNVVRSPLDYVPHTLILWALTGDGNENATPGLRAKQLPGLETEALLNWHRRLWENTYDNTYFGARLASRSRVPCQDGPARIYQGLKSSIAYSLLSSWSTAPVQLFSDKKSQIARVKQFFADEERLMFPSRAVAELAAFVASLSQTVDSLSTTSDIANKDDNEANAARQRRDEIMEIIFEGRNAAGSVAAELVAIFDAQIKAAAAATPSLEGVCELLGRALREIPAYVGGEKRTLGGAWALLGLAKVSLLVPPPTDPAAKSALKLRAAEEREGETREEISVLRDIETVTTGNASTGEIAALEAEAEGIVEEKRKLAAKAVERPATDPAVNYATVHAEIARCVSMVFPVSKVVELLEALENASTSSCRANNEDGNELSDRQIALLKEEQWQESTGKVVRSLCERFGEFPDIVQPLCVAAYEIKYGLRLMSSALAAANSATLQAMRKATVALSTYPRSFTDAEAAAAMRAVISPAVVDALHEAGVKTPWRVFSAALSMGTTYVAATTGAASATTEISPAMMGALNAVFDAYTKAWEKCEEKKRALEEERAKEFETKTHVTEFINEKREREEEEEEVVSLFPDYSSQFADLAPEKKKKSGGDAVAAEMIDEDDDDDSEDEYKTKKDKKKKKKGNDDDSDDEDDDDDSEISDKALRDVGTYVPTPEVEALRSAHMALFGKNVASYKSERKEESEEEKRKRALLNQYRAAAILVASISSTPEELDTKLTAIHTAVADLVGERMDTRASSLRSLKRNGGAVDIYKESCIEETVLVYEPLLRLEKRISEFLLEWPEHATLQAMIKIVRRILLMPLHSPLMKFVIGLETLLSQAQIWEQCAASHVSLAKEMGEISSYVARWRRLELMSWPLVLKTRERQHATSSGVWWFHLYSALIQARPDSHDAVTATVKTVSDFLQTSALGQFQSRVEMVGAFAEHLSLLYLRGDASAAKVTPHLKELARSIVSLYRLYAQFVEPCNARIANLRQKVEEELKEFIRLASWERLEYYSLKDVAAKSHKKLTKLSKKYDKILRGTIADVLSAIPAPPPETAVDLIVLPEKEEEEENENENNEETNGDNETKKQKKQKKKKKASKKAFVGLPPSCSVFGIGAVGNDSHTVAAGLISGKDEKESGGESPLSSAVVRRGTEDLGLRIPAYIKRLEEISYKGLYSAFAEESTPIGYVTAEGAIADLRAHGQTIAAAGTKPSDMPAKRLAFKMIGDTLRSLGISTSVAKRGGEQTKGSYLMASPQAGPALRRVFDGFAGSSGAAHTVLGTGEKQLWSLGNASAKQAEALYFNVVAALQNFRQLRFKPSADLQLREIDLLDAFTEHLAALTLVQRRTLHNGAEGLSACAAHCAAIAALTRTDAPRTVPEQRTLRATWDALARVAEKAKSATDDARRTLAAAAVPEPGTALAELESLAAGVLAAAPAHAAEPLLSAELETQTGRYLDSFAAAINALRTAADGSAKIVLSSVQSIYAECADAIAAARAEFDASRATGNEDEETDDKAVGARFNTLLNGAISQMLVAAQEMSARCKPLLDSEKALDLADCHDAYRACLEAADCGALARKLGELAAFVSEYSSRQRRRSEGVVAAMHAFLGSLHGLLHQYLHSVAMVLALAACFHAEFLKIFSTTLGIFTNLYTRGWNMVIEDDSNKPVEGEMQFADGTGMGEGEGEQDVSDQIEDSGQLNTGGDEQQQDENKQPDDPDKGFDMGDEDFEGSIQDVPQPSEEDKNEDKDSDEDDEEKEEDDKQMGQVDDDLSEKVDRKFWEGEDEEEKDLREELEKGDAPKTTDENEMEAQDDDDEEQDEDDKKDDKKQQKEDRRSAPNPAEPPEVDENEEDNEVEEEGEFIDEEDEEEKESDPFNKNPENQPFDQDESDDENKDDNGDDEFAEDMELDQDSGNEGSDDDEEGDEENEDARPEDLGNPDGSDLSEDELDENDFDQKDKGQDDLEEPEQQENEEEKNEDEINNNNENDNEKTDQQEHNKEDQVFGVNDMDGNASESNAMDVEQPEQQEQSKDNEEDENNTDRKRASGQSEDGEYQEIDNAPRGSRPPPQANLPRPEPAPYTKPSEALKKWKKRLQLVDFQIERKSDTKKKETNEETENNEEEDVNENNEYAKTDENDNSSGTENTIAPVMETDDLELPDAHDDEDDKDDSEDDPNKATKDVEKDDEEEKPDEDDNIQAPQPIKQQPQLRMADDVDDEDEENLKKKEKDEKEEEEEEKDDDATLEDTEMTENMASIGTLIAPSLDAMSSELGEYYIARETEGSGEDDGGRAIELWTRCQSSVARLSEELCEQLRIILEPTLATQLKGDYRTGKRINMKKVIPYIASQFKKDKIWLRRTRPHKRHYQVLLAIDDSESMKQNHAGGTALEALALISAALTRLEVGDIGVLRFGNEPTIVHDFSQAFTDSDGARVVSQFTFAQGATDVTKLTQAIVRLFETNAGSGSSAGGVEYQQIVFIISDGRFGDKKGLQQWINEAQSRHMFVVFIIIDDTAKKNSIMELKTVSYPGGKITISSYIDSFPFPFYVVLRNINSLPDTLASALRQWFELLKNVDS